MIKHPIATEVRLVYRRRVNSTRYWEEFFIEYYDDFDIRDHNGPPAVGDLLAVPASIQSDDTEILSDPDNPLMVRIVERRWTQLKDGWRLIIVVEDPDIGSHPKRHPVPVAGLEPWNTITYE